MQQARGFYNARIPVPHLRKLCALDDAGERTLETAVRRLDLAPALMTGFSRSRGLPPISIIPIASRQTIWLRLYNIEARIATIGSEQSPRRRPINGVSAIAFFDSAGRWKPESFFSRAPSTSI